MPQNHTGANRLRQMYANGDAPNGADDDTNLGYGAAEPVCAFLRSSELQASQLLAQLSRQKAIDAATSELHAPSLMTHQH